MRTDWVLDALEQAPSARDDPQGLIRYSDRGSQYLSIRYAERLTQAPHESPLGRGGDSHDNAEAETTNGRYKTGVIPCRGPWRSRDAVEYATLQWVDWFNNRRLVEPIRNVPPAEYEAHIIANAKSDPR